MITLKLAATDDIALLYEWQIDDRTRRYFFNSASPTWEEHVAWVSQIINSSDRFLLIGYECSRAIGVLRIDVEQTSAEVSIYIAPNQHNKGYGTRLLAEGKKWLSMQPLHLKKLVAKVHPENEGSKRIFKKNDFQLKAELYEIEL